MSYARLYDYNLCIQMIQAEKAMLDISVASFPHMKKEAQKKIEKKIKKLMSSNLANSSPEEGHSTEALYHKIMGQLGG